MNRRWSPSLSNFIRNRIGGRALLKKVIGNAGWLFADRIIRSVISLIVGVWTIRYLGPDLYGSFTYALAIVALVNPLTTLGLDAVVVRRLVQHPDTHIEVLGSAFVMRTLGAVVGFCVAGVSAGLLRGFDSSIVSLVLISAIAFFFQSFDCIDLWFQATMRNRYSVVAKLSAFLIIAVAKIGLIVGQAPLVAFAWAGVAETVLGAAALYTTYRLNLGKVSQWRARFQQINELFREGLPLAMSGLLVMIYMRIDQVMIGQMLNDEAVGIYSAATRLAEVWYMLPMVIVSAAAPAIVLIHRRSKPEFDRAMQRLFDLLTLMSYAITIPIFLLAEPIVHLLYGVHFAAAAGVLKVQAWSLVFVSLSVASGYYLLQEGQNYASFERTLVGAILNVGLNLMLIPAYGPLGAAWATLLSYAAANFFIFRKPITRPCLRMMIRALLPLRRQYL